MSAVFFLFAFPFYFFLRTGETKEGEQIAKGYSERVREMTEVLQLSLQCYMGRFCLPVDPQLSIRETLRYFRRKVPELGQVDMDAYAINYNGKLLLEETITLKSAQVGEDGVLILVKKSDCPAADTRKDEDDE
ncbi:hypothetical protein TcCL_ESM04936 [Trypanosoma cruzi]|nr:hypothetical protein TcCL_ESM04936 [Trypanosoma cruzi]